MIKYKTGPIHSTVYQSSGCSEDWVDDKYPQTTSLAIEVRGKRFDEPPSQIEPTCNEIEAALMVYLKAIVDMDGPLPDPSESPDPSKDSGESNKSDDSGSNDENSKDGGDGSQNEDQSQDSESPSPDENSDDSQASSDNDASGDEGQGQKDEKGCDMVSGDRNLGWSGLLLLGLLPLRRSRRRSSRA